jgi:hypothetical protein
VLSLEIAVIEEPKLLFILLLFVILKVAPPRFELIISGPQTGGLL